MAGILGFIVATAYWPGLLTPATLPREMAVAIGVPLLLRVEPRLMDRRIGWLLLFGVAWAFETALGVENMFWLLVLAVAFVAGAGLKSLDGIMTGLALGISISSVTCVAQLFGWQGVWQNAVPAGLFYNREVLAELAAPVAVWAVIKGVCVKKSPHTVWKGFLTWGLVLGASLPLVLCGERIAVIAAAVGFLYLWRRPWRDKLVVVAGIAAVGVIGSMLILPGRGADVMIRIGLWGDAAAAITPLGHGLGWFATNYPKSDTAHSDVLQMLAELGAGAAFFLTIPVLCFVERRGSVYERAILAVICVEALVSFPFELVANGFLAAVVTGYLGSRRNGIHVVASVGRDQGLADPRWGHVNSRGVGAGRCSGKRVSV